MAAPCNSCRRRGLECLIALAICLLIATGIAIPWVNAIDKRKNDPEWQEHKDDPDYWGWP